ncbi:MAG TPA: serine-type D-Ala-D-Ala carboxypeptidase [Pseudomonas sp.]|jgi:D-alanyl-D-alanine carboxypeptidase (penicillin-binding protein 5/6)|uniref:serine-type D-Ala-D-Ala carboxypeptidase n=1 Tax=Stutzerimonas frequens TaxID=2968969 RepID=A0AA47E0Y0_9GAMM|nr:MULTISPECIES: D-alanyl-D-alanine carboxypeptidase family protein [Stutzerimonas]MAL91518.1 serine-type D-Ala-D-Ala carboxypeptidase [Pseudomonas sp.]MCD1637459.1 D-alanyl-D-alanine carboxypeptidase [Stutzerimonas stutzeri]TDL97316.1 D-alanyl-D-alanine carboxypeptidase [Stutzerimonas stutzeri ATCC 17588 = LMG 11199]AWT08787.1 serine-type D-Ala-D-Ala carboxypeptidase [Stutzerimonas frequens]MBK3760096.1 serine-type D-Ala-D-Ala carboxypeptidase [Stutzerimonas frequens]|tara:strand:+ start:42947 stop:44104 length:1158 start_codon:yes stop_codon:yes gene_type:complete
MNITSLVQRSLVLILLAVAPTVWAAQILPSPPQLAAKSYMLMDAASGEVLVEHNGDERLPPASLTKLMTAYIATLEIQKGQISDSDMVTVSEKAWRTGGSRMFIQVNTQVSVDDLLHGIIIQSGNDASVAMAEHIAGSEEAFADLMNATAQRLGMTNSHFMNATGLPDPEHYSSANDMAKLARAIIYEDPAHYAIYAQKEFLWNNIKQPNRNLLLWRDKTVDGLKTGHTEEAGYCLVASAVRDNMRLISVVFGTDSEQARAAETQKLLTYGFRFFETRTFYQKGTELAEAQVWKGQQSKLKAGLAQDLTMTLPRGQVEKLQAVMSFNGTLTAPIQQGDVVGKVEVKLDDKVVRSTDLVALETVEEGGLFRRFWDSIRLFFYSLFN